MNLKKRLMFVFSIILLISWGIITFWVWVETNEQMEIVTDTKLSDSDKLKLIQVEINEIFLAITLPIFLVILSALLIIILITNRFLKPFIELSSQLQSRNELNLTNIDIESTSKEAEIITLRVNQLLEKIAKRIEYEKQFTADVAHELRTPLAGMKLTLELMEDLPERTLLLARVDDLLVIIERLLQFARANHELHSTQAYQFNFYNEVVLPLQAEYESDYPNPIRWDVAEDATLKGEPSLVYLLMKNLLDNAKQYAGHGIETSVVFIKQPDNITLVITDAGKGIEPELLSKLTQRYQRADESRNGFGLGLNIVERIVHAHDGIMTIENRKDGLSGIQITIQFKQ